MDKDNQDPNKDQKPNTDGQGDDSAGKDKDQSKDTMIPKNRLDEEISKRREAEKKLEEFERQKTDAEKKRLEDEGKTKELLELEKKEKESLKSKYETTAKKSALKVEALKQGTLDADAVVALTELSEITLTEDGEVDQKTVEKAISKLKQEKAYLFGGKPKDIGGGGGAPNGGSDDIPTFKRSQLQDHEFYKKNKDQIMRAYSAGKIIDDIAGQKK